MSDNQQSNEDSKIKRAANSAAHAVGSRIDGDPGSVLWCIRKGAEWVHEGVVAVNSILANNRAEKAIAESDERSAGYMIDDMLTASASSGKNSRSTRRKGKR